MMGRIVGIAFGLAFGLLLGTFLWNTPPSYAVTNFTANVFGVSKNPDAACPAPVSGDCIITLSKSNGDPDNSYNGFTIAGISGNPARIVASDTVADSLRLENAVITGPAGVAPCSNSNSGSPAPIQNCPTIYFSGVFSAPPDNNNGDVTFTRSIGGTLMRGATAATNSAVRMDAWVESYAVGSPGYKKVTCLSPTPNCGTLNNPQIGDTTQFWGKGSGLPDPREHSVQIWFYSKFANDTLRVDFARLESAAGAGGGKPSCVVYPPGKGKNKKDRCPTE